MTKPRPNLPSPVAPKAIGIYAYPGSQEAAVLGIRDMLQSGALEVARLSAPDVGRPLSALILPPRLGDGAPPPLSDDEAQWIRGLAAEGTVLCAVCVGAFLLGDLGLLDGRPATTHWALSDAFRARCPRPHLDTDRILIDDGDVITAGGLMAWVDLALHLLHRFAGPRAMSTVSSRFLVDPGGREQRFYRAFSPPLQHGDEAILKAQRWLQRHSTETVTVAQMAAEAGLTPRTFIRRFQTATGMKSRRYLQHLRVEHARRRLAESVQSQQEIAWAVGYEDASAFSAIFQSLVGLTPTAYRRRFQGHPEG